MVGQQLRLTLDELSEMLIQHRRDARVQFLASGAQHRAVGCVLYQGVLEEVGRMRRRAPTEQQPGRDQSPERSLQLGFVALRRELYQLVGKFAPKRRAGL